MPPSPHPAVSSFPPRQLNPPKEMGHPSPTNSIVFHVLLVHVFTEMTPPAAAAASPMSMPSRTRPPSGMPTAPPPGAGHTAAPLVKEAGGEAHGAVSVFPPAYAPDGPVSHAAKGRACAQKDEGEGEGVPLDVGLPVPAGVPLWLPLVLELGVAVADAVGDGVRVGVPLPVRVPVPDAVCVPLAVRVPVAVVVALAPSECVAVSVALCEADADTDDEEEGEGRLYAQLSVTFTGYGALGAPATIAYRNRLDTDAICTPLPGTQPGSSSFAMTHPQLDTLEGQPSPRNNTVSLSTPPPPPLHVSRAMRPPRGTPGPRSSITSACGEPGFGSRTDPRAEPSLHEPPVSGVLKAVKPALESNRPTLPNTPDTCAEGAPMVLRQPEDGVGLLDGVGV